ncbi:Cell wall / vacuolar inhibitor of fructosidase 1 [Linum perenne]
MRTSAVHPPPLHLLILLLLPSLINSDDLIYQTCNKTPFYDLCAATLHSNSSASSASDINTLALSATNIVLANATGTLNYIQLQLNQTKDLKLEKALAKCVELYIPVVKYVLPQAIEAFGRGNYAFVKYSLSYASKKGADDCQKKLSGAELSGGMYVQN